MPGRCEDAHRFSGFPQRSTARPQPATNAAIVEIFNQTGTGGLASIRNGGCIVDNRQDLRHDGTCTVDG